VIITSERTRPGPAVRDPSPEEPAPDPLQLAERTAVFAAAFLRWVEAAAGDGLPYPRLRLLEELHCRGPAIMSQLAAAVGLTRRSMTSAVDALESERLVARRPHPEDRRATLVELTGPGLRAADEAFQPRMAAIAALFDGLDPDDRAAFARIVAHLTTGLRTRTGPRPRATAPDATLAGGPS